MRKLGGFGKTVLLGEPDKAKGVVDFYGGVLRAAKHVLVEAPPAKKGKKKKEDRKFVFLLMQPKDGLPEIISVSSSGKLNFTLLEPDEKSVTGYGQPKADVKDKYIEIKFLGRIDVPDQPQPIKDFDISVDDTFKHKNLIPIPKEALA